MKSGAENNGARSMGMTFDTCPPLLSPVSVER